MIQRHIFTYILFVVLVLTASYEDIKTHNVYAPLLLALIPVACFLGGVSFYVIASITISILCLSRFFKIQSGDKLAYFVASFFLNESQVVPFFALNIGLALATWVFTVYVLKKPKKQRFALIPSILFPCLIIRAGPDIIRYIMSQSQINQTKTQSIAEPAQAPNLALLVPSLPIKTFGNGLQNLIKIMYPIMSTKDGIGLAAPQIGYNVRVILLSKSIERFSKGALSKALVDEGYVLVNPRIVSRSDEKIDLFNGEGCISLERAIPGKVQRHKTIMIEYQNIRGELVEDEEISMHLAIIVQHEIDHLFGILYPARMKESDAKSLWAKYVKDLRLGVNQVVSFNNIMQTNLASFEKDLGADELSLSDFRTFAQNIGVTNNDIEDLVKRAVDSGA